MHNKWSCFSLVLGVMCATSITWSASNGAQRIELKGRVPESVGAAPTINTIASPELAKSLSLNGLSLEPQSTLALVRESGGATFQHLHFEQTFQGVPIWGDRVVVSRSSLFKDRSAQWRGSVLKGIGADIPTTKPTISPDAALEQAMDVVRRGAEPKDFAGKPNNPVFSDGKSRLVIFFQPMDGIAKLTYEVTFFAIRNRETGEPTRPVFITDAKTGETLYYYDALAFVDGTGPGGNQKTGEYYYGKQFPPFVVSDAGNGQCSLSNPNPQVDTEDLEETTTDMDVPFKYKCYENTTKPINGAYAPMNDAHYFGALIYKMWTDWYGEPPIRKKLVLRVHYSKNFEQAFWNGRAMYFGDGFDTLYPVVALDVTSHEIAHGYTENHSELVFDKQSGGINEAFSDMAAMAAIYYRNVVSNPSHPEDPNFLIGPSIMKQGRALRDMCDPPSIGKAIGSAKDYHDGLNPHVSSGVYNKAFCLLAKSSGWNARKAFQVFQVANRDFWTPLTNFEDGAEGVRDAAKNLGYSAEDVRKAFAAVDVVISP